MKKYYIIWLFALCALCGCRDNSGLYVLLNDYDYRIAALEQLCSQLNTNIAALQNLVNAQQSGDYITAVTPIMSGNDEIGYTITFGNNESITIYNGKNGKDGRDGNDGQNGQNGVDGSDGHTPIIGVAQDSDGVYYWTLDGSWLLDNDGNKLRVTGVDGHDGANGQNGNNGHDGVDGQDGKDGKNGTDGTNGVDGVTPQLKIEADYWYVSYDNGLTWKMLGKATGDDGKDGQDGKNGENGKDGKDGVNGSNGVDGDSMFESIDVEENYVVFTLANGTTIKVARSDNAGGGEQESIIKDGAICAAFSVSPTKKVYFSKGNLQYQASTNTWRFAEHQWDIIGEDNMNMSATYEGWIDLFPWGSSGYDSRIMPYTDSLLTDYITGDITNTNYDWGVYNPISNGGNQAGLWRTLTFDEHKYLLRERPNASILAFQAEIYGKRGTVFLPDHWAMLYVPNFSAVNSLLPSQWAILESHGAVFSSVTGSIGRYWSLNNYYWHEYNPDYECYWSSTFCKTDAWTLWNNQSGQTTFAYLDYQPFTPQPFFNGYAVRLVQDVPSDNQ